MAYLVLARKYRPQTFAEMSGQEHVVRTLSNALRSGQLAHAFLFTGPRGVGKTTAARLVAKCLDCEKGPTAEPCGVCAPCVEIAEGRCVDVVEIDAASNNGVDNVRDIVEAVKYRPARDRFKVFVIDEVHMLSTGAFNALLKTLEEPPEHVKFVLATTDVHKVPETIVSRCQRFDFRRLTQAQLVGQLRKVADAERLRVSDAALALVARAAEGGMRDALSMLDQVRAACGDDASDAAVAEAVGAVDAGAVARLGAAMIARDGARVLAEVEALHARGQDMKRVAQELVRHLRDVVVAKLVPQAPLDLADAERREVSAQAEAATGAQLARLFDLVQRAATELKTAEQPRYALEVELLKACFLAPGAEVQELIARLEGLGTGAAPGRGPSGAPPPPVPRTAAPAPAAAPRGPASPRGALAPFGTPGCAAGSEPVSQAGPAPSSGPDSATVVPGFARVDEAAATAAATAGGPAAAPSEGPAPATDPWRAVVAEVERASPAAANALKQGVVVALGRGEVSLRVPPGMAYGTLDRRRAELEVILARVLGGPTRLVLAQGSAAEAAAPEGRSLAELERAERAARSARVKAGAQAHPNIQQAAEILGGKITSIDEL